MPLAAALSQSVHFAGQGWKVSWFVISMSGSSRQIDMTCTYHVPSNINDGIVKCIALNNIIGNFQHRRSLARSYERIVDQ